LRVKDREQAEIDKIEQYYEQMSERLQWAVQLRSGKILHSLIERQRNIFLFNIPEKKLIRHDMVDIWYRRCPEAS